MAKLTYYDDFYYSHTDSIYDDEEYVESSSSWLFRMNHPHVYRGIKTGRLIRFSRYDHEYLEKNTPEEIRGIWEPISRVRDNVGEY